MKLGCPFEIFCRIFIVFIVCISLFSTIKKKKLSQNRMHFLQAKVFYNQGPFVTDRFYAMLDMSYLFETWHDDSCQSQKRKPCNIIIFNRRPVCSYLLLGPKYLCISLNSILYSSNFASNLDILLFGHLIKFLNFKSVNVRLILELPFYGCQHAC